MKTIKKEFTMHDLSRCQQEFIDNNPLFFDIETTGFSSRTTHLYLIGCGFYKNRTFQLVQYFAESPDDEPLILNEFQKLSLNFPMYGSFNGLGFDIPYLRQKCHQHHIDDEFLSKNHYDFFKELSSYKTFFGLENFKQKTIESWLHSNRQDPYNGGELISAYKSYVASKSDILLTSLLLHNEEDVLGLSSLCNMASYEKLFSGQFLTEDFTISKFKDYQDEIRNELRIPMTLTYSVPKKINYRNNGIQLFLDENSGILCTTFSENKIKYYYENYKDYWYFKEEDRAIHKSLASFAPKGSREKATKDTAYQYISLDQLRTDDYKQLYDYTKKLLAHLL